MSESPQTEIFETADGSKTLRHLGLDVTYRSIHGARQESLAVFVDGTWTPGQKRRVLELGLGAATNLALTIDHAREHDYELEYIVFEKAPVLESPVEASAEAVSIVSELLASQGNLRTYRDRGMCVEVLVDTWGSRELEGAFDSVYFDPFGPSVDTEAWTRGAFEFAAKHMKESALLGTYSAATAIKRAMVAAGLFVASAPGPGRKREITFASLSQAALARYELLDSEKYR